AAEEQILLRLTIALVVADLIVVPPACKPFAIGKVDPGLAIERRHGIEGDAGFGLGRGCSRSRGRPPSRHAPPRARRSRRSRTLARSPLRHVSPRARDA